MLDRHNISNARKTARVIEAGLFLALLAAAGFSLGSIYAPYPNADILAPIDWLQAHRGDPDVRIIDARGPLAYRREHISGAVNVGDGDMHTFTATSSRAVRSPGALQSLFRSAGVDTGTTVVIYDDRRTTGMAERLFWILEYLGHEKVKVLAGGVEAWKASGGPTTGQVTSVTPGNFTVRLAAGRLASLVDIQHILAEGDGHIIDARPPSVFRGETGRSPRKGHIPGAANVRYEDLFSASGIPRRAHSLRLAFSKTDVHTWHQVVVYGETGVEAAPIYFALRLLGSETARLYDGSWTEWVADDSLPVEAAQAGGGVAGNRSTTCW